MSNPNAEYIAKVLGGAGRIRLMTGCNVYSMPEDKGLLLKGLKRSKFQSVVITYNAGADLFNITFIKVRAGVIKDEQLVADVYVDQLKSTIESYTGLYLSL